MKKIMSIIGSISLITTTSFLVIACKTSIQMNSRSEKSNSLESKNNKDNITKNKKIENQTIEGSNESKNGNKVNGENKSEHGQIKQKTKKK